MFSTTEFNARCEFWSSSLFNRKPQSYKSVGQLNPFDSGVKTMSKRFSCCVDFQQFKKILQKAFTVIATLIHTHTHTHTNTHTSSIPRHSMGLLYLPRSIDRHIWQSHLSCLGYTLYLTDQARTGSPTFVVPPARPGDGDAEVNVDEFLEGCMLLKGHLALCWIRLEAI